MVISELIVALQKELQEHGDVIVAGFDSYRGDEYEVTSVHFHEGSVEYAHEAIVPEGKDRILLWDRAP